MTTLSTMGAPVHSTLQSVFDKIWKEFVVDGRAQGYVDGVGCKYRGEGDATSDVKCIIGVCIPDDMYDPDIENRTINGICRQLPAFYKRVFNGIPSTPLTQLQLIHDSRSSFKNMETELTKFAVIHSLCCPTQGEKE